MPINIYDEGIVLVNAQRILNGEFPNIDFWTIYPPGQFLVYSLFLKIYNNLLFLRLIEFFFGLFFINLVYKIIIQNTKNILLSILSSGLLLLFIIRNELRFYPPIYPAIFLTLLITYNISLFLTNKKKSSLYLVFLFQFLLLFFRQDIFIYSLFSLFIFFLILKKEVRIAEIKIPLLVFALFCIVILLVLYLSNSIHIFIEQLLIQPLNIISNYRKIHIGFRYYLYLCLSIIILLLILYKIIIKKVYSFGIILYPSLFCLAVNKQMLNRADSIHSMPVVTFLLLLISFYIFKIKKDKFIIKYSNFFTILILVFGILFSFFKIKNEVQKNDFHNFKNIEDFPLLTIDQDKLDIFKYIKKQTNKNDYVYIGVTNHDKFTISEVMLYYLFQRKIPTMYTELHPGITNTLNIQKSIIKELLHTKTKYIVLADDYWFEENKTKIDSKIDLLDNFIFENYNEIYKNNTYRILKLK